MGFELEIRVYHKRSRYCRGVRFMKKVNIAIRVIKNKNN